jgi:hypothetical protein
MVLVALTRGKHDVSSPVDCSFVHCPSPEKSCWTRLFIERHSMGLWLRITRTMLCGFVVSLLVDFIRAHPVPTLHLDQSSSSGKDTRTILNIIWSSLVALFACVWVSVHPNVPAPTDGSVTLIKQRAKLLLTAVIAPEIIIVFAMRQWVGARRVMQSKLGKGEEFASLCERAGQILKEF